MKKELAVIKKAGLNWKDRSIFTFYIDVDYENGWSQRIGTYTLDTYDKNTEERIGTAYGMQMIMELSKVLDVNNLHEAVGQNIFVLGEEPDTPLSFIPVGIQALRSGTGKKIIFNDVYKKFEDE